MSGFHFWGGGEVFCQQLFLFSFEQGGPAIARTIKRAVRSDRPTENSAVSLCSTRLYSSISDDCLGFMAPNKTLFGFDVAALINQQLFSAKVR